MENNTLYIPKEENVLDKAGDTVPLVDFNLDKFFSADNMNKMAEERNKQMRDFYESMNHSYARIDDILKGRMKDRHPITYEQLDTE